MPPKSVSLLAQCDLANTSGIGCAWCGAELPKRRRTWCSDRCANEFWSNHWWSLARAAAKRRDKYRCRRCSHEPPKRPTRRRYPVEAEYKAAMRTWRRARRTERVEVNHIVQAKGRHGSLSCVHHLNNLETLCVRCHKSETSAQAKLRKKAS